MAQVLRTPTRTAHTVFPVRDDDHADDNGVVHGARLVDIGGGELRPVLPVCGALIDPVPADGPITCEICQIRLRPDSFTEAVRLVRRLLRRWFRGARERTMGGHETSIAVDRPGGW